MEKLHPIYRLLILMVILANSNCSTKAQQMEDPEQHEATTLVAAQFKKWENGEGSFFELLDEDVIWTVSGKSPVSGVYRGKSDFLTHAVAPILGQLKTPLKPELVSLTFDGTYIWLHFKATATNQKDEIYENTYVWKLHLKNGKITEAVAFLDTYALTSLMNDIDTTMNKTIADTKEYIGMWVTKDGYIRHELLPNNRYDEARGNRKNAYQGAYKVTGNRIDYKDDTGFTADGEFKDGILYHAGMILYKENK